MMLLKQFSLLLLLIISVSLLSTSIAAGRQLKSVNKLDKEVAVDATDEDMLGSTLEEEKYEFGEAENHEERTDIHERLLRVNTKDYGRYNPAPALVKPPFKLIPN
ncbi:hypothetical protein FNV43_RR22832 [Rhamnella rubrinervis]|uniref:Uncharacterized protein n=1 Tax=Rhamnella rubrinervis TaxID=2594499 RepID=A0A8K0DR62_9ROSA|nr:hypothetical protein FNV43_RR22832 [Rhamnella rubrinervis]